MQTVGAPGKVESVQRVRIRVLDSLKPGASKFSLQFVRGKKELKRLARRRHTSRQYFKRFPAQRAQRLRIERIVEAGAAARRHLPNHSEGRSKCVAGEVRNDSKPSEKCGRLKIELSLGQPFGQCLPLEIQRDEAHACRCADARLRQQPSFPLLRRGKIHFEDAQRPMGIAESKGVEPRPEDYILRDTRCNRFSQPILGIPAARNHKRAKSAGDRMPLPVVIQDKMLSQQRNRDRIVQHARPIEHLVGSAAHGYPKSGSTGATRLHVFECRRLRYPCLPRTIGHMTWIGWAILSAIFAAATALLAKVGVEHVDSNLATAIRTSVVVVFAWGIALALGKHSEIRLLDRRTVLFLTLSGLATGLSWLCYFRALQLGPASRVAPLDKLSVPLVMIFAWLLLGEKLTAPALLGGALITAGAVVMVLA